MSKYYVVWHGRKNGIFNNWSECFQQIQKFPKARYKSFKNMKEAEEAYNNFKTERYTLPEFPKNPCLVVDGACNVKTGLSEYQGYLLNPKTILFKAGPFAQASNNLVEFLAIVHALAYCKKNNFDYIIYSDSLTAITWVKKKAIKTTIHKNGENIEIFKLIERAIHWLNNNEYDNELLKWETDLWGENPADFGRK